MPLNRPRKSNLRRAIGKVSADQSVMAYTGWPASTIRRSSATFSSMAPSSISSQRP